MIDFSQIDKKSFDEMKKFFQDYIKMMEEKVIRQGKASVTDCDKDAMNDYFGREMASIKAVETMFGLFLEGEEAITTENNRKLIVSQ